MSKKDKDREAKDKETTIHEGEEAQAVQAPDEAPVEASGDVQDVQDVQDVTEPSTEPSYVREREELTPEQLLEEITRTAKEGSIPSESEDETEPLREGEWSEEKPSELEKELGAAADENTRQTTAFLVELLNGLTVSLTAAISGTDATFAEKKWSFTARERKQLYNAALPVVKKYGVAMPSEAMLIAVIIQIEAPRLLAARQFRQQARIREETETTTTNEWEELE